MEHSTRPSRRTRARAATLLAALAASVLVTVMPVVATEAEAPAEGTEAPAAPAEGTEAPAAPAEGAEEDEGKITFPESWRDRVGLILLGAIGLGSLAALDNARRQLKGERKQATGDFRWR